MLGLARNPGLVWSQILDVPDNPGWVATLLSGLRPSGMTNLTMDQCKARQGGATTHSHTVQAETITLQQSDFHGGVNFMKRRLCFIRLCDDKVLSHSLFHPIGRSFLGLVIYRDGTEIITRMHGSALRYVISD